MTETGIKQIMDNTKNDTVKFMTDWYRRKTWTKNDEEEFFLKLNRARKDSRAQYLKIQAIELIETKKDNLLDIAESLIFKIFSDFPDNRIDKAQSLCTLGDIYRERKNFDKAMDYYKQAIKFEAEYPNVKTQAYLSFSELAVKNKKISEYDFVEKLVSFRVKGSFFPIEKYKDFSILSIISGYNKKFEDAKNYAKIAEENATALTSDLQKHKNLGLVKKRDNVLDDLVKENLK